MADFEPKNAHLDFACEAPGILYGLCSDPEVRTLYGGGADFAVYRVDLAAEKPAATKAWTCHASYVASLAYRDGVVISAGYDGRIVWTRGDSGEPVREVAAHDGWVRQLALFADGSRLASAGDDMRVTLWDAASGAAIRTLDGHARQTPEGFATALYAVAASPDGKHVAAADRIGETIVWNAESGEVAARWRAPEFYTYDPVKRTRSIGGVRSVSFSPDGSRLLLAGIGQVTNVDGFVGPCRIELWDWKKPERVFAGQDKHKAVINCAAFHPSGLIVGAGGGDGGGLLAFWDGRQEAPLHLAKPKGHAQHFVWTGDGSKLYLAGHGGFQSWVFTPKPPEKKAG